MSKELGRPSEYKEEYNKQVYRLCLLGAKDSEIADFFDVSETTINNWKLQYPAFLESIKEGKVKADSNIADRLYNRAMGYTHAEEKIFCQEGIVTRVDTVKHYPPDTVAAMFWLKNRQPEKWREKQEIKHDGHITVFEPLMGEKKLGNEPTSD